MRGGRGAVVPASPYEKEVCCRERRVSDAAKGMSSNGGVSRRNDEMSDLSYSSRLSWLGIRARAWTVAEPPKYPDNRGLSDLKKDLP